MLHLLFAFFALGRDTTPCAFADSGVSVPPPGSPFREGIFTKVEKEAYYQAGQAAWKAAVDSAIGANRDFLNEDGEKSHGTCWLQFVVRFDGSISDVRALTMEDSHLAQVLVRLIEDHPCAWHPAIQNGRMVNAFRREKIMYP